MNLPATRCNCVTLEIPSDPAYLKVLRGVSLGMAAEAGFPEEQARLLSLGLEEACTNVMRHAYENCPDRPIRFEFRLERNELVVEIVDGGKKACPDELKSRDLKEVRPGGLGVHLIREVFDSFEYDASDERFNRLRLVKHRPVPQPDDPRVQPSHS